MKKLKLSKYLQMPGNTFPVTGCKKGDIAPYVILTNIREHVKKGSELLSRVDFVKDGGWDVNTVTGEYQKVPITICCSGIGVGQTSNVMEELIKLGAKVFIQSGATGALQESIGMGNIIIPTGSVRDEGLTDYYAPKQFPAVADFTVVNALVHAAKNKGRIVHTGIIRTTEGFYPSQRIEKYVDMYSNLGILGVEQEVSAIFTIAAVNGCHAGASLLVIGNLVTGHHVFKGDNIELLQKDWIEQLQIILDAMVDLYQNCFPYAG